MTQVVTGTSGRVTFEVPDEWTVEPSPRPEIDAMAYLRGPEGTFAPNVVLTVVPYSGGSAEFLVDAIDGIASALIDPYVIDARAWLPGGAPLDDIPAAGRALTYTHQSPNSGTRLRVTEWLLASGGLAVQMTTTATVAQWPVLGPTLAAIASSLVVARPAPQPAPIPDAALDGLVSGLVGQDVERISGLASLQPYPFDGEWVHGSSLELFHELAEGTVLSPLLAAGMVEEIVELERLGIIEGHELTTRGDAMAEFFRTPGASLRITAHYGEHEPTFQAWVRGPAVLIAASTSYGGATEGADGGQPSRDHFNVAVRPVTDLTTLIGRWVGLQPAWNLPVYPAVIPAAELEGRWRGGGDIPEGASETLRVLWHENWFTWDLIAVGPESEAGPISYLNGGRLGHFRIGADPSGDIPASVVIPARSVDVFDQLEDALQACLFGRQPIHG